MACDGVHHLEMQDGLWPAYQESAYGTAIGDAQAGFMAFLSEGEPITHDLSIFTGEGLVGAGHAWPTDTRKKERWDARLSKGHFFDTTRGAWAIAHALGKVTTADNMDGSYLHTIKPMRESIDGLELPSSSLIRSEPGESLKRKLDGLVVARTTVEMRPNQRVRMSYDLVGSGRVASNSKSFPSLTIVTPIIFEEMTVAKWGAVGGSVSELDRIRSVVWEYDNAPREAAGYLPGSTAWNGAFVRSCMTHGTRSARLTINFLADRGGSAEVATFQNQTVQELEFKIQGDVIAGSNYHHARLVVPRAYFGSLSEAYEEQIKVYTGSFDLAWDETALAPFYWEIQNTLAGLLQTPS